MVVLVPTHHKLLMVLFYKRDNLLWVWYNMVNVLKNSSSNITLITIFMTHITLTSQERQQETDM